MWIAFDDVEYSVENNGMVRVKICGITNTQDALGAADAGADAIGLNFVGGPRKITIDEAGPIIAGLPPYCSIVALMDLDANPIGDDLWNTIAILRIRTLQLYGVQSDRAVPALLSDGFLPVLVHRVSPDSFPLDFQARLDALGNHPPSGVVFDAHHPQQLGGTGRTFDWKTLRQSTDSTAIHWPRVILAGGLDPSNVTEAVRITQPYAVDVSSGVETSPGKKCPQLMRAFVQAAKGQRPNP